MTDTAELIAKLRAKNMHLNDLGRTALIEDPDCIEAADALASLVRERDELRARLFPYADDKQISGMSWDGFYLIGNDKSIKKLRQIENDAAQLSVYRAAFDERNKAADARATAAEANAARMREARAMPSDETARAFIAAWREKYPGAGFPTLGDAKEMLAATFGVVNYSENNDLQEVVLSCRTLDDLKATQQTILAMRALTT